MRERIKFISSILLVICLVLPISSCTRCEDSSGKLIAKYDPKIHTDVKCATTYNYPLKHFDPKNIYNWLLLLCFIWPIPILAYRKKGGRKLIKNICWGIEPIFVVASSWYIYMAASLFAKPFVGAYLAILANIAYGITWMSELQFRRRNT